MKLYNLYEQLIFEETGHQRRLLTEGVSRDDIIDAIKNRRTVNIHYRNADGSGSGLRYIKPEVYGQLFNGNYAIVAYQITGESKSEGKGYGVWRIFRVDRIGSWETKNMRIPNSMDGYNPNGSQKGNFIPGKVVDTFRKIIYQYKPTQTEPTQTEPTQNKPVTKEPVQQAPVQKQTQAKPSKVQTKSVQQEPKQVQKPTPSPVQKPIQQKLVKNEPELQNNLEKEKI